MSDNKQKLELTWIGKNNPEFDISNIEPRILEENPELSNCTNDPNTENMIIHGDNLLALKALLPEYEGKIKCIYIDPPYNTGNAFEHYDDNVEHSLWLSLMKPRMELLKELLSENGIITVQIDDKEGHYLKVLMDEVFDRRNFVNTIAVQSSTPSGLKLAHRDKTIIKTKDYILVYKKGSIKINPQYKVVTEWDTHFNLYFDKNSNIVYPLKDILEAKGIYNSKVSAKNYSLEDNKFKNFVLENSDRIFQTGKSMPENIRQISLLPENKDKPIKYSSNLENDQDQDYEQTSKNTEQYAFNGRRMSFLKNSIHPVMHNGTYEPNISKLLCDFWDDIDFNNTQNEGSVSFPASKKPEMLIFRLLNMFTSPGDIVLDSFLGSGTTASVAHKLGRKYIGIEMGIHAFSHCKKRIDHVINGTDLTGVSKIVNWKGGGAYKFYELAPSFITVDEYGNQVIDSYFNDTKLIRAMCKLLNFEFKPSQSEYWKHGIGQGNNYIYVTTQILSVGNVQQIKSYLKPNESLTICAKKFEPGCEGIDSKIIVKKIPQAILNSCQFGKKEYLLPIKEEIIDDTEDTELD